jgi:hypothetical protein
MINWRENLTQFYKYLVITGAVFVGVYLVFQIVAIGSPFFANRFVFQLFDVGHEANVPTYFSVLLFFILAILSWLIGVFEKGAGKNILPWVFTMILFLFLGLDELASLHEQLTYHTQKLLNTSGFLAFAWTIPYLIALAILSIFYIPFIWKLKYGKIIFLGAFIFILGAVGFEMVGSYFYDTQGVTSAGFIISSSIEEILEISGLLVAIYALKEELLLRVKID